MEIATMSERLSKFLSSLSKPQNATQQKWFVELSEFDFPTTKNEYWKYTRLNKIASLQLKQENSLKISSSDLDEYNDCKNLIVFENGIFNASASRLEKDISITKNTPENFVQLHKKNDLFLALNDTFCKEQIQINITKKQVVNHAIALVFLNTQSSLLSSPNVFIHAAEYSESKFSFHFIGNKNSQNFINSRLQVSVGENAKVEIDKIQNQHESEFIISNEQISQAKNSNFKINTVTLNGAIVRNNIDIQVQGENCETHMNGAIIAKGTSHIDNHTFVDHQVANCFSNENYKYVLDEKSTGVFNGRVIVQQHAQKINAYQKNANILLSDFAQINSKPELEIYADDVKCSHGSTTGQLDEDAVFYLQTRGISKNKAQKLLVSAFTQDVFDEMNSEITTKQIQNTLSQEFGWNN